MTNFKKSPRNSAITFKLTEQEKIKLQGIADKRTNGKVSQLIWEICTEYLKKIEEE